MSRDFPTTSWYFQKGASPESFEDGPTIPSEGFATSAVDLCRYQGLAKNNNLDFNFCYSDRHTIECLGRLIEGPITCVEDLEGAENALQIIFWHDVLELLSPAVRFHIQPKNDAEVCKSYHRAGYSSRSEKPAFGIPASAMELLEGLRTEQGFLAQEAFIAPELITVVADQVMASSDPQSPLLGQPFGTIDKYLMQEGTKHWNAVGAMPLELASPAYFSDPRVDPYLGSRGFLERFYSAVKEPWERSLKEIPMATVAIDIPPLVAIVLDAADTRETIPAAILKLREELRAAREEMRTFNRRLQSVSTEKDLLAMTRSLQAAFDATFVVARKTNAARRRHTLFRAFFVVGAIRRPLSAAMRWCKSDFGSNDPFILVDRTQTTKMFSELLDVESIYGLLETFLSEQERMMLHRSIVANRG